MVGKFRFFWNSGTEQCLRYLTKYYIFRTPNFEDSFNIDAKRKRNTCQIFSRKLIYPKFHRNRCSLAGARFFVRSISLERFVIVSFSLNFASTNFRVRPVRKIRFHAARSRRKYSFRYSEYLPLGVARRYISNPSNLQRDRFGHDSPARTGHSNFRCVLYFIVYTDRSAEVYSDGEQHGQASKAGLFRSARSRVKHFVNRLHANMEMDG